MARMIPVDGPRSHTGASREDVLYNALSRLPDDYYVVHSMTVVSTGKGLLQENEADFVVFNPHLGLVCIEAKAGRVRYEGGRWRYANGSPMKRGGPYEQARHAMHRIMDAFDDVGLGRLQLSCKFLYAVWFPSLSASDFRKVAMPTDVSFDLTLCADDLPDPEPKLRRIFELEVCGGVQTELSEREAETVVQRVICPEFSIAPNARLGYDLADAAYARLLDSQARVLNFLEDQRMVAINGAAGTGKTLIAVERARRAAAQGDKVLLLCFNALLKDDLKRRCKTYDGVDVYTIAGFACAQCSSSTVDYEGLGMRLIEYGETGDFPYDHVIVDEGQDFGIEAIGRAGILETLRELVCSRERGSFYFFYDKRQFIQGSNVPLLISDADCKLTLYVNCRNPEAIAKCAMRSLGTGERCEVREGVNMSGPPEWLSSSPVW